MCRLALNVCDGLDWSFECLLAVQVCQVTQFVPVMAVNPSECLPGPPKPPHPPPTPPHTGPPGCKLPMHLPCPNPPCPAIPSRVWRAADPCLVALVCDGLGSVEQAARAAGRTCMLASLDRWQVAAAPAQRTAPVTHPSHTTPSHPRPGMNVYDIRKQCEGPLCYREFEILDEFLNQASLLGSSAATALLVCFGSDSVALHRQALPAKCAASGAAPLALQGKAAQAAGWLAWSHPCPLLPRASLPVCLQDSVRKDLGVGDREWEACNMDVHRWAAGTPHGTTSDGCRTLGLHPPPGPACQLPACAAACASPSPPACHALALPRPWPPPCSDMMADWGHSFDTVLPEMLAAGVRVMVYVGDQVGGGGSRASCALAAPGRGAVPVQAGSAAQSRML